MDQSALMRGWEQACRRLARRINLGWWLQCWLPILLGLSLAGSTVIILLRTLLPQPREAMLLASGIAVLASGFAAWWMGKKRFETGATARIRLEDALSLNSQLSSASAGASPWPPIPNPLPLPVEWRWSRAAGLVLLCMGLLALAFTIPVASSAPPRSQIIEKPGAVTEVEQWINQLKDKDAISPENATEVQKQIDELIRRPQDQWYQHATLEAAEHLKDETGKSLQELGTQLEQARGSVTAMSEVGSKAGEEARSGLAKQAADNLKGLRSGAMKAGSELSDQLKNLDPNALKNMSKEQLQSLANRLKQNAEALREALANAPKFDFKECASCNKPGQGEKEGPGKGGPTRGRGDADLTVKKDETQLNTNKNEDLAGMLDVERIAPGDLLGTSDGKAGVDPKAYKGPTSGGAASNGSGGSAVWQNSLIPAERETLKRYFK